jgi:hypothetical protein
MAYTTYALKDFIDSDGNTYQDIYLDNNGNIATVSDEYAIIETVKTNIGLWLGEYIYNVAIGVDYNNILGQVINEPFLYSEISNAVKRVYGVLGIYNIKFKFDADKRVLNITIYVKLNSGVVEINVESPAL